MLEYSIIVCCNNNTCFCWCKQSATPEHVVTLYNYRSAAKISTSEFGEHGVYRALSFYYTHCENSKRTPLLLLYLEYHYEIWSSISAVFVEMVALRTVLYVAIFINYYREYSIISFFLVLTYAPHSRTFPWLVRFSYFLSLFSFLMWLLCNVCVRSLFPLCVCSLVEGGCISLLLWAFNTGFYASRLKHQCKMLVVLSGIRAESLRQI